MKRTISTLGLVAMCAAMCTVTRAAVAEDKPFVDRPLALSTLNARIEAGLGFGQSTDASGEKLGTGANLEAALGLPFFGEVSVRTGYRFGNPGKAANADYFGRLFDHQTSNLGHDPFANPEIGLRGQLFDLRIVQVGLESRFVVPLADGSVFTVSPGAPVRIHVPGLMRIDTGVWALFDPAPATDVTISVPVDVWFQAQSAFFGPMSGFRYNVAGSGGTNSTDIPAGLGGGYTFFKMLDVKAQLYTLRINDSNWSKLLGGGFGVALLIP